MEDVSFERSHHKISSKGSKVRTALHVSKTDSDSGRVSKLTPVVQEVDSAIHWINHYPADNTLDFVNTYPLDSDLSGG